VTLNRCGPTAPAALHIPGTRYATRDVDGQNEKSAAACSGVQVAADFVGGCAEPRGMFRVKKRLDPRTTCGGHFCVHFRLGPEVDSRACWRGRGDLIEAKAETRRERARIGVPSTPRPACVAVTVLPSSVVPPTDDLLDSVRNLRILDFPAFRQED